MTGKDYNMTIKQIPAALKTDRGVCTALKRNVIVVGDSDYAEFANNNDRAAYIKQRRLAVLGKKNLTDEAGELDEGKVKSFYVEHYARLEEIAVPWEEGLKLETNDPRPVLYDGKIYECIQGIVVNDPNHTPDVTHAHYKEIPKPAGSGYPAWVPPTSTVYYNKGDRMTYTDGKNYESLIGVNVYSPEEYPQGWKEIP
jgi:hypothetical protein